MDNESTEPEAVQEDIPEREMEPEQEQPEEVEEAEPEEIKQETKEVAPEPEQETEPEPEEVEKLKEEPKKEPTAKQKAATKIVKDMGDKGRYEAGNQLKTLIVMQVLGDTKTFFDSQKMLQDTEGFFTNDSLPDTILTSNNIAQYMLFGKSNTTMERLIDSQYK